MKKHDGNKLFNEYLTDEQIYDFVIGFKGGKIDCEDFDTRKCDRKLAFFKAFRYGVRHGESTSTQEYSEYTANFETLEDAYQNLTSAFLKCRTYINKLRKLVQCKCVDTSRQSSNISELSSDILYFAELLLALHSRRVFSQSDTARETIRKKVNIVKTNLNTNVAIVHALNTSKKEFRRGEEVVTVGNIISDTNNFFTNLDTYAEGLGVINRFLVDNQLDKKGEFNCESEEHFNVLDKKGELKHLK